MEIFLRISILAILLAVIYQDFKFRAVSLVLFPMLLTATFLSQILGSDLQTILIRILTNSLFLSIQFIIVSIYFYFRTGKASGFVNNNIGSGDILFMAALTPCFDLPLFILFIIASHLFALSVYGIPLLLRRIHTSFQIPFAGMIALFMIAFNVFAFLMRNENLNLDIELNRFINGYLYR